jgi:hypothetical protein
MDFVHSFISQVQIWILLHVCWVSRACSTKHANALHTSIHVQYTQRKSTAKDIRCTRKPKQPFTRMSGRDLESTLHVEHRCNDCWTMPQSWGTYRACNTRIRMHRTSRIDAHERETVAKWAKKGWIIEMSLYFKPQNSLISASSSICTLPGS